MSLTTSRTACNTQLPAELSDQLHVGLETQLAHNTVLSSCLIMRGPESRESEKGLKNWSMKPAKGGTDWTWQRERFKAALADA